jgi:DNA-binding Lrp family transcriptional regulator
MQDSAKLDELDLKLVNCLQIQPRASWSLIADVIGVDGATVARRWTRLSAAGHVWISAYPAHSEVLAYVEIDCLAGASATVADAVAADPRVGTVEHTTGEHDLLLTVFMPDLRTLSEFLLTTLGSTPGVVATRVLLTTVMHSEGSRWRLRSLDAEQTKRIERALFLPSNKPWPLHADDRQVYTQLLRDPRISYSDLAARTGLSITTARRRLNELLSNGVVTMRCELAQPLTDWPISAALWGHVPPARLERIARQLSGMPETRMCAAVTGGSNNLLLFVWLRDLGDVQHLEAVLDERIPELTIKSRAISLGYRKRMGWLLDDNGCATKHVPIALNL